MGGVKIKTKNYLIISEWLPSPHKNSYKMIRFDGYYSFEPTLYQEREEYPPNYLNMVYSFTKNGEVRKINRWSTKNENLLFTKEDFDKSTTKFFYIINKSEMYLTKSTEKDAFKSYYDIISENEIKHRDSGDIMRFVKWENKE